MVDTSTQYTHADQLEYLNVNQTVFNETRISILKETDALKMYLKKSNETCNATKCLYFLHLQYKIAVYCSARHICLHINVNSDVMHLNFSECVLFPLSRVPRL